MVTYEWNCKTVDVYPQEGGNSDVVYNVHWIVNGVSDTLNPEGIPYSSNNIGTQILSVEDIPNFIPFDQLTNEDAVNWTQTTMGVEQVASIEQNIAEAIESKINPTSITLVIGEEE
jgi:hypothetical protein